MNMDYKEKLLHQMCSYGTRSLPRIVFSMTGHITRKAFEEMKADEAIEKERIILGSSYIELGKLLKQKPMSDWKFKDIDDIKKSIEKDNQWS